MIWGAIARHHALGPVVFQNIGTGRGNGVTAQRYINQVLRPSVVPFFHQHGNFILQDNARPHTARLTANFLQQHNIRVMPWPARSPDLNPIEHFWNALQQHFWDALQRHFWDALQRELNRVQPRPRTHLPWSRPSGRPGPTLGCPLSTGSSTPCQTGVKPSLLPVGGTHATDDDITKELQMTFWSPGLQRGRLQHCLIQISSKSMQHCLC